LAHAIPALPIFVRTFGGVFPSDFVIFVRSS